jgi:8-oxo-dGTP pyrophosphatase MutT (NUDIX family)
MSLIKQFTATAYIVKENQVLLHFHKKLGKWLPPGGHLEEGETPPECAIREAKEETSVGRAMECFKF